MTARHIFRHSAVWLHRWFGLIAAPFLIVVGLTGSIIAFYGELDRLLNPELLTVRTEARPPLDPFTLRERAEAIEPRATADDIAFEQVPGRAFAVWMTPKVDPITEDDFDLGYNQLLLNPYTGEKIGSRHFGEVSLERKNVLSLIYRLHYSLLLPGEWHETGRMMLGIVALAWTIDCFVGFYLTLPVARRTVPGSQKRYARLQRWRPAWKVKTKTSRFRIVYDLHRAAGLWTWVMLFVLAWSGVAFNLPQVYDSAMSSLLSTQRHAPHAAGETWLETPELDWRAAHAIGRRHMDVVLAKNGYVIESERHLRLDREHALYIYGVKSTADLSHRGVGTQVIFNANTGALVSSRGAGSGDERAGDAITRWLIMMHKADVYGLPMQIVVCLMGLVVAVLSVIGLMIYLRKQRATHRNLLRRRS